MSQNFPCNDVMGSLNLNPFTFNPIQSLLPVTGVHSQFTPLSESLINLWGTRNFINKERAGNFPETVYVICDTLKLIWFGINSIGRIYSLYS